MATNHVDVCCLHYITSGAPALTLRGGSFGSGGVHVAGMHGDAQAYAAKAQKLERASTAAKVCSPLE